MLDYPFFNHQMQYGEKLSEALSNLLDISEDMQKRMSDNMKEISHLSWLKEFCTIKCCTSRRGGHDYAISEIIRRKFKDKKVLIVCPTQKMLENQKKEISYYNLYAKSTNFVSANNILDCRGLETMDVVIVNCSSQLSQTQIDKIYDWTKNYLVFRNTFFIIFMQ